MTGNESEIRPWGSFTVLDDAATHKVKTITVLPGHRLSYQRHEQRSEHWFVVTGTATVTVDDQEQVLARGGYVDIPALAWHRLENRGTDLLTIVEVQHGSYFGEDDIERRSDDYGRV
jgi:mannose-6-phosphate isomerase